MCVTAIDKKKRIHMARKSNSADEYKKKKKVKASFSTIAQSLLTRDPGHPG